MEPEEVFFTQVGLAADRARGAWRAAVNNEPGWEMRFEKPEEIRSLLRGLTIEQKSAILNLITELTMSHTHSMMVILDGGAGGPVGESVVAATSDGARLDEGLNERWVDFAFDRGILE